LNPSVISSLVSKERSSNWSTQWLTTRPLRSSLSGAARFSVFEDSYTAFKQRLEIGEDEALRIERAAADETLRRERKEQARTLAALLPLDREKTDRYLLTERARRFTSPSRYPGPARTHRALDSVTPDAVYFDSLPIPMALNPQDCT
jgi:hypothetical protein